MFCTLVTLSVGIGTAILHISRYGDVDNVIQDKAGPASLKRNEMKASKPRK
jgi:hypothetical protein